MRRSRHCASVTSARPSSLLGAAGAKPVLAQFERELEDIQSILKALSLVRSASHRSRDLISGFGEVWSARQIAAFFKVEFAKTRDVAQMLPEMSYSSTRAKCS